MTTYTVNDLRVELTEIVRDGGTPDERYFKAQIWPVQHGWDSLINDMLMSEEKEIERLISLSLEGKQDEWGNDPMTSIGRVLVKVAERRADATYTDMLDDAHGEPDFGYDVPETQRQALDRSAA